MAAAPNRPAALVPGGAEEFDPLDMPSPPEATWSTTNAGEAIPGVPTPLAASVWGPICEIALRRAFHAIGALSTSETGVPNRPDERVSGIFCGRPAVRVDMICRWVERVPGTSSVAMAEQTFSTIPPNYVSKPEYRYYPRVAARALIPFLRAPKLVREDRARVGRVRADALRALETADEQQALHWLITGADMWTESMGRHTILMLGALQPAMDILLKLADSAGVSGQALMAGYGGHEETATVIDAWAVSRGRLDLDTFVERHGYHGWHEGEVSATVWREDPTPVTELVEGFARKADSDDPALGDIARRDRRRELEREFLRALPRHRRPFGHLALSLAERYIPLRGVGKVAFLQGIDIARAAARRLGHHLVASGKLDTPQDIFYLTLDELRAGGVPTDAGTLIRERRATRERFQGLELPDSWQGTARAVAADGDTNEQTRIQAVGASPGVVEGPARVVLDPLQALVDDGDILIARETDPSWAPLMFLSSGLVADIGGLMSHTAIVAREIGVPCVVSTKRASALIRTGDRIRVDGTTGVIDILERAPERTSVE